MTQRYDLLPEAAQRLARVPRTGRLLARLPPAAFDTLKTDADVYWRVYSFRTRDRAGDCGLLADGLKVKEARRLGWRRRKRPSHADKFRRHQIRRATDLLGAIAFEMMASIGGPNSVIETDYGDFQDRVLQRFLESGAYKDEYGRLDDAAYLSKDWDCLLAMNSHGLKHFIFSTDANDQQLRWTDVTTLGFFAAYWACRWADDRDRTLIRDWVIDPVFATNEEYREFWTFAADMPNDAIVDSEGRHERWEALFAPLYDGSLQDAFGYAIQSKDFICYTWNRMKGTPARKKFLDTLRDKFGGQGGRDQTEVTYDEMLETFFSNFEVPGTVMPW